MPERDMQKMDRVKIALRHGLSPGENRFTTWSFDDTPAAAIAIGGLAVNMNVEGQPEHFYGQTLQREEGAAGSSAGGSVVVAFPMSFSPGAIVGLPFVSAAAAAQFTEKASAR